MSERGRTHWMTSIAMCAIAMLSCEEPPPPYAPDSAHLASDRVLYLHSATENAIFRFALDENRYLPPLPLAPDSRYVVYSATHDTLYVAYGDGSLTRFDLARGTGEEPFGELPSGPAMGLTAAGPYLVAVAPRTVLVFDENGTVRDESYLFRDTSEEFVWSAATERIYQTRDASSPNDIHWLALDLETGTVSALGESPYHGDFPIRHPLRISRDGAELVTGAGLVYDADTLEIRDAIPLTPSDAIWLDEGLITLTETEGGGTRLDHWNPDRTPFNHQLYPGRPVKIIEAPPGYLVITQPGPLPTFHHYVPSDDPDGDGVGNSVDAFPLDPAASRDTDLDGHPDAWNEGREAGDSTTGLALDAFPQDSACWLPRHGRAGACAVADAIPHFDPDDVVVGSDDVAYLLAADLGRIFRFSLAEGRYLNPIVTDGSPTFLSYSRLLHRLYLAYPSRAITTIHLDESLDERPFAVTFQPATGLAVADPHVVVAETSGSRSHHSFAPDGKRISWVDRFWTTTFLDSVWSPIHERLYFFRNSSPGRVEYEAIDPDSGAITGTFGTSPFFYDFPIAPPLRLSPDESRLLLGSGNVYDAVSLDVLASLPIDPVDASWPEADALLTLRPGSEGDTVLEHWNDDLQWLNTALLPGRPRRILAWSGGVTVMTIDASRPRFSAYVPTDDADGDGIPNDKDAFALDPAASIDSDRDGYPDAWNPGRGQGHSTTGLRRDAFPEQAACWGASQGTRGRCDVAAAIPEYVPDRIDMGPDDLVYLLSKSHRRIFRWSAATGDHLDPIPVGAGVRDMAHAAETHRLYVGYGDGRIRWVDPTAPTTEEPFAVLHNGVRSLTAFGAFLFGPDVSRWTYVHGPDGSRLVRTQFFSNRDHYAWSEANSRLYLTCCSPQYVMWIAADTVTGEIEWGGGSPYHDSRLEVRDPLRIQANGDRLLDGTGKVWDGLSLEIVDSLPWPIADATWDESHLLVLRDGGYGTSIIAQRDPHSLADWGATTVEGEPLRILPWSGGFVAVTQRDFQPRFELYEPPEDADEDGVANRIDAFPLDPAASSDTDGDGAPDGWNPGSGPEDSTTGLALDAFPTDYACQAEEHGRGGICDFAWIVPADPVLPLCANDDIGDVPESGLLPAPAAVGLVPLCNGWVAYADTESEELVVRDLFSGRFGLAAPLPGAPIDLELDAAAKRIYVAIFDDKMVAAVDLVTGDVASFPFPDRVRTVRLDVGAGLIVSTVPYSSDAFREHYHFDTETGALEGPIDLTAIDMAWHPQRREIIAAHSSNLVYRVAGGFQNGFTLVERAYWGYRSEGVALSPDLQHVAFATRDINGDHIAHFASDDLQRPLGVWRSANFPWDVAFDLDSNRLAASGNEALQIFDVESHALLDALVLPPCADGWPRDVGFSRGGALAFVRQDCGEDGESVRFHWLQVD